MTPSIRKLRPELYKKLCTMQLDLIAGGFDEHADAFAELADWTEDLLAAAGKVVAESGPNLSPSNGVIDRLSTAITGTAP